MTDISLLLTTPNHVTIALTCRPNLRYVARDRTEIALRSPPNRTRSHGSRAVATTLPHGPLGAAAGSTQDLSRARLELEPSHPMRGQGAQGLPRKIAVRSRGVASKSLRSRSDRGQIATRSHEIAARSQ